MPRIPRRAIMNAALPGAPSFHAIFRYAKHQRFGEDPLKLMSGIIASVCALLHYPSVRWHGYAWMPTHEHFDLSVVDDDREVMSKFLHRKSNRFARLVVAHDSGQGLGSVLGERASTIPKKTGLAALLDLIYQHDNPVQAGFVSDPGEWRFSSYNYYAYGRISHFWEYFLTPLPEYVALAATPERRQKLFRLLTEAYNTLLRNKKINRGIRTEWKAIGDAAFIRAFYETLEVEIAREQGGDDENGSGLDGAARDVVEAVKRRLARTEGDPDPGQYGAEERLPACCWMHMNEGQRMGLKLKLGKEWDDFRKRPPAVRDAAEFAPSAELLAELGRGPSGFTVERSSGPRPGMKELRREAGRGKRTVVETSVEVPAVPAAPLPDERGDEAGDGLPGQEGASNVGSAGTDDDPGIVDDGDSPGVRSGVPNKHRRTVSDAVMDLEDWRQKHQHLMDECGHQYEELIALLTGPDGVPRLRRKRLLREPSAPTQAEEPVLGGSPGVANPGNEGESPVQAS